MANSYDAYRPEWSENGDHDAAWDKVFAEIAKNGKPARIDAGGFLWRFKRGLKIDCGLVRQVDGSTGARFWFENKSARIPVAVLFTQSIRPVIYDSRMNAIPGPLGMGATIGGSQQCQFYGVEMYADPDSVDVAFYFHQPESKAQEFASGAIDHCYVHGFGHHLVLGENAYMVSADNTTFRAATTASYAVGYNPYDPKNDVWWVNSGEGTSFHRCTFADSYRHINARTGAGTDHSWTDCRMDYPQGGLIAALGGGMFRFNVLHMESRSMRNQDGNPAVPIAVDNGSELLFNSCNLSQKPDAGGVDNPAQMVQFYGAKGYVTFDRCYEGYGFQLGNVDAQGRPTIANDPDRVRILRNYPSGGKDGFSAMKGRMAWNWTTPGWAA